MQKGRDLILVMGATGNQGQAVARELLGRGHRVRATTRRPDGEPARALAALGAEIVQVDFADSASLERAMAGAWGAFAVQNTWEAGVQGEEEQGKRVAEIARKQGVSHFVYTSVGSAQRATGIPHFDNKWRVEQRVRELGFPSHTILRPVFFMENLASPWFKPAIDQGNVAIGMKPETRLQMIAVKDIGQYGALAFERHAELADTAIDIAGDAKTGPEIAGALSAIIGRPVGFFQVPMAEVRKFNDDFATMLEWFDRTGYDADIEGNARRYGIRPTRFEEWARTVRWS